MYACLHHPSGASADELLALAAAFSPAVEQTREDTVAFSIDPLRRLLGSPYQIASEICRYGYEREIQANLAVASNVDTAILLARHFAGVTLVTPGEERFKLAALPIAALFVHNAPPHDISRHPKLLEVLHRWGVKTCEELAALPERGLAERLGPAGVYLRNLACGTIQRPLRMAAPETSYEQQMELEQALDLLEPLLFLLGSALGELCRRLRSQSRAARRLEAEFTLEARQPSDACLTHGNNSAALAQPSRSALPGCGSIAQRTRIRAPSEEEKPAALCGARPFCARSSIEQKEYRCALEFPVPLDESQTLLKLLQLHLERHPPEAAVTAFRLRVEPAEPRRIQGGFFLPPAPPPDKLQITLARIAGMVGKENVGSPVLLNTHRPDAFEMGALHLSSAETLPRQATAQPAKAQETLRLVMRLFRPALPARVSLAGTAPKKVFASCVKGTVVRAAGPWKTSGEWWTVTAWNREEWDVALDDGALYRIYREMPACDWYVHGVYD